MATTFRTVLNRVLGTLKETQVATAETFCSNAYQILVSQFINQIKEDIEDAHNWRSLQTYTDVAITGVTYNGTAPAGAGSATITGTNERSRVRYHQADGNGRFVPLVFDITAPTSPVPLDEYAETAMDYLNVLMTSGTTQPSQFTAKMNATGDGLTLQLYPIPSTNRTIRVFHTTPQTFVDVTTPGVSGGLDTVLLIPTRALLLGSIWYALEERGEELGQGALFSEERFRRALAQEVGRDAEAQGGYQLVAT